MTKSLTFCVAPGAGLIRRMNQLSPPLTELEAFRASRSRSKITIGLIEILRFVFGSTAAILAPLEDRKGPALLLSSAGDAIDA